MAREESEREDLLRDATSLVARVEIIPSDGLALVAGFRPDGAFSVFFGEDPAYHFNAAGELRRAYCSDFLFKATSGRLASLRRERMEHETQLVRHELTAAEQDAFLAVLRDKLRTMASHVAAGNFRVAGQVPQDVDVVGRVRAWLDEHQDVKVASRPNV